VASLEQQQVFFLKTHMHQLHSNVVKNIYKVNHLTEGLYQQQESLLQLLKADGIAVVYNKDVQTFGVTPDANEVEDLALWLQVNGIHKLYQNTSLSSVYDNAGNYAHKASGLLVLPIQADKGNYILAFRPEVLRQVSWGGNPNEAITFEPDGKAYHPRNSFKIWQETLKKNSLPWSSEEMEIAENFRNFVVEYTLNKM
jgi:two-component system, chemotaxis family, sensor kinase Cph1